MKSVDPMQRLLIKVGTPVSVVVNHVAGSQIGVKLLGPIQSFRHAQRIERGAKTDSSASNKRQNRIADPASQLPAGSNLLSDLKSGQKFTATVVSTTTFGAFMNCNVYRVASGGRLVSVQGMLHRVDLPANMLLASDSAGIQRAKVRLANNRAGDAEPLVLDVGTEVTVYVKHVMTNSG
jgi:hypothetical protein